MASRLDKFFGVGFDSSGFYSAQTICGRKWNSMLTRCYSQHYLDKFPSYLGCKVSDEWKDFKNFSDWWSTLNFRNDSWEIDKDILFPNNKIYSESTCVIIPPEINTFISIKRRDKISNLPTGVTVAGKHKYIAQCSVNGKQIYSPRSSSIVECYEWYKNTKQKLARELAIKWETKVDPRVTELLSNFAVEKYGELNA